MLSILSFLVLLVGVLLSVPQILELLTGADWWGRVSDWRFRSPISLPPAINAMMGAAAIFAGIERGLRLRYHWLLDH